MPPRRRVNDHDFASPGVLAERRAIRRRQQAAERRREYRRQLTNRQDTEDRDLDNYNSTINYKQASARAEHENNRYINEMERRRRALTVEDRLAALRQNEEFNSQIPTMDFEEEDMFNDMTDSDHDINDYTARGGKVVQIYKEGKKITPTVVDEDSGNFLDSFQHGFKKGWDTTKGFADMLPGQLGTISKFIPTLGRGWEDELKAAMARDAEREQDKKVAEKIRAAAGADAHRRSIISHKTH